MTLLCLENQKTTFTEKFQEYIDWQMLIKMILQKDILNVVVKTNKKGQTFKYENEEKQLIEILKMGCKHSLMRKKLDTDIVETLKLLYNHSDKYMKEFLEVKYFYDKKKEIGRVYPEKSLSLCSLRKDLRHMLANGNYIDIDMVNAHFKIADQIFNKDEIKFPILHDYVINRNHYLKLLGDHFKVEGYCEGLNYENPDDYDILKEFFVRKLYYGTNEGWKSDNNLPPIPMPDFVGKLEKELEGMANIVKENNSKMLEMVNEKTENVNGTILSWFLQEHERRLLEKLYEFLCKKKQIIRRRCVLCFDGIMILLNDKNKENEFVKDLLNKATEFIQKETGINIEFKAKPFDRLQYKEKLETLQVDFVEDPIILIDDKDDNDATDIIYEMVKDDLVYCRGQYYMKKDNIWTIDEKQINSYLMSIIMKSGIKTTTEKGNIKCYAQHTTNAKNIMNVVKLKVAEEPQDNMYIKFHQTPIGKLCFKDGVLFIKEKKFRKWTDEYFNEEDNKIYSTICIDREFEKYFVATTTNDNTNFNLNKQMNDIKDKIFTSILDTQTDKMLHFLSRAMAGYYEDKDWGVWIGSRNCGKGCINTLLRNSFENYVTSLPAQLLLVQRMRSNDVKEMSWLLDLQYPRLAVIQELDKKDENSKINGTIIKSIASGGDPQKSRRNHGEITEFLIDTKLLIMVNDLPKVDPVDVLETCIQFNSGKQFKTQDFIDNRKKDLLEKCKEIQDEEIKNSILKEIDIYLLADDNIKHKCNELEWGNAFILLLMNSFVDKKLEPSNDSDLKDDTHDVRELLNEKFIFSKNNDYKITNKKLKEINDYIGTGLSFQKFKNELIARGCKEYRTGSERGLMYLKEIESN